jgi:putative membrane protein
MRHRYLTLLTTTALLTAAASVAQPQTVDPSTGMTSNAPMATRVQLQGLDATFLQRALEMGRVEVAHAQTALDSAERSDTRTAARMLLEDHQRANQQLEQLASRKGWSMPTAAESAESDQARAAGAGGFDDDRFMTEQIRMHRDAISLYRAQVSSGDDPELRQYARDQLPHLEHHLEMLQGRNTQK